MGRGEVVKNHPGFGYAGVEVEVVQCWRFGEVKRVNARLYIKKGVGWGLFGPRENGVGLVWLCVDWIRFLVLGFNI